MNIELMKRVRDRIADESVEFDMDDWGCERLDSLWESCGTAACIAGHALLLERDAEKIDRLANQAGLGPSAWSASTAARVLLGIDFEISDQLFYASEWPGHVWNALYNAEVTERRAAVYLLDELIAGRDPWEHTSVDWYKHLPDLSSERRRE